ncbi:MAG TPA: GNAT family acetyltransferase [Polyangiaceae bacterium]|nr:GNAT family acetyltransferase [Polyangiaceae bacterium]
MSAAEAVVIGRFEARDEDEVVALWTEAFGAYHPSNEPRAYLVRKLAHDPELVLVAREGARVVGTVVGGYDGVRGWIYHLAVAPAARRRGIATRLMAAVERELLARGCPKINLQVLTDNIGVVAF